MIARNVQKVHGNQDMPCAYINTHSHCTHSHTPLTSHTNTCIVDYIIIHTAPPLNEDKPIQVHSSSGMNSMVYTCPCTVVQFTVLTSEYKSPHVFGLGWYYSPHPVDQLWHQHIAISSQPLHGLS